MYDPNFLPSNPSCRYTHNWHPMPLFLMQIPQPLTLSSSNSIVFQLPIKLGGSHNLTTWKPYLWLLMHGHYLFGHIEGTTVAHPISLTRNNETTLNPHYMNWFRKNHLVQNTILASVRPTLASTIAIVTLACKTWESMHTTFANKSLRRIICLKD